MTQTGPSADSKEINLLFEKLKCFYPKQIIDVDCEGRIQDLDDVFSQFEVGRNSFFQFISGLINCSIWQSWDYDKNPLRDLCLNLSNEVDRLNDKMTTEPAYHSRAHFQDVCLSLTILLMQDDARLPSNNLPRSWHMDLENRWILLFCAIGHDFGHDGSINQSPFELEKASLQKIDKFLGEQNCLPEYIQELMSKVEPIILSTDPSYYSTLCDQLRIIDTNYNPIMAMSGLMVESDLLASVLPKKGMQLSLRLGEEWKSRNAGLAKIVSSTHGRLSFLSKLNFFSMQAKLLGMREILSGEILNLKSRMDDRNEQSRNA